MCKAIGRKCAAGRWWEGLFWSLLEVCEGHQQGLHYSTYSAHGGGSSSLPAAEPGKGTKAFRYVPPKLLQPWMTGCIP